MEFLAKGGRVRRTPRAPLTLKPAAAHSPARRRAGHATLGDDRPAQGDLHVNHDVPNAFWRRTGKLLLHAPLTALLWAAPLHAAEPWPAVQPGGRAALQTLSGELERHGQAISAAVVAERQGCEISRTKGKPCGGALLEALTRLLAVVNSLDGLRQQLASRLAEQPPAQLQADRQACDGAKEPAACERLRADDAALDGFAQLRVAPALESLGRLAQEASRDLQLAKAMHASSSQKLPAPPADKRRDPRLDEVIEVKPEGTDGAPPPPPPAQLLSQCKTSAGKGDEAKQAQAQACLAVAGIHEARREPAKAREFYRLACKLGAKAGCARQQARGKPGA